MFRRKEEGFDDSEDNNDLLSDVHDESIDTSAKEAEAPRPAPAAPSAPAVAKAPSAPAFRPQSAPNIAANRVPSAAAEPRGSSSSSSAKASKRILTVGNDIHMKGEISTCDRLVIEGSVDATLKDVHTLELAETGSFKGTAEVEDAEISGMFEGDLTVNGRLIIYSTGQVRGNVSYDEIEIERGGQLSGSVKTSDEAKSAPSSKKSAA